MRAFHISTAYLSLSLFGATVCLQSSNRLKIITPQIPNLYFTSLRRPLSQSISISGIPLRLSLTLEDLNGTSWKLKYEEDFIRWHFMICDARLKDWKRERERDRYFTITWQPEICKFHCTLINSCRALKSAIIRSFLLSFFQFWILSRNFTINN